MIIDFRVRPPYGSFLKSGILNIPSTGGGLVYQRQPVPSHEKKDLGLFIGEMDQAGIDWAVVMGRYTGSTGGIGLGSITPDDVYEIVNKYPNRLMGFAGVDPSLPDAPQTITRAIKELGLKGIAFEPGWGTQPRLADDPLFTPSFDTCAELGIPVVVTLSVMVGPDLSYASPIQIQHLAARYPKTNFLVPHAAWPYFDEMMAVCLRHRNVYMVPDFYFCLPCMGHREDQMLMYNTVLSDQVVFASSYPVRGSVQALHEWKSRNWAPEALKKSLYDNAARVLGMA